MLNKNDNESIDPRLKAMLEELRPTPPRNPDLAARSKAQFLSGVDAYLGEQSAHGGAPFSVRLKEKLGIFRIGFSQRTALNVIAAVVAILVLFFGSAGMTALASQSALPGDALYTIKTGLEETRSNLSGSAARQVTLQLQYAQRRLEEIEKLIAEGRYDDIKIATQEFQRHIQNAIGTLENVAANDPTQAADLAAQITSQLSRYALALSNMAGAAPDLVRSELQRAVQASQAGELIKVNSDGEIEFIGLIEQINPDIWVIDGQKVRVIAVTKLEAALEIGLMVRVHARRGADGILVAREIELAQLPPLNINMNGNFTGDDSLNGNLNGEDDSNANSNDDSSRNDNEDQNFNQNRNQNEDGDHRSNDNDTSGEDSGSGGSNSNDNTDGDHNENDNDRNRDNDNDHNDNNDNGNSNDNDDNENDGKSGGNDNDNKNENGFLIDRITIA